MFVCGPPGLADAAKAGRVKLQRWNLRIQRGNEFVDETNEDWVHDGMSGPPS